MNRRTFLQSIGATAILATTPIFAEKEKIPQPQWTTTTLSSVNIEDIKQRRSIQWNDINKIKPQNAELIWIKWENPKLYGIYLVWKIKGNNNRYFLEKYYYLISNKQVKRAEIQEVVGECRIEDYQWIYCKDINKGETLNALQIGAEKIIGVN